MIGLDEHFANVIVSNVIKDDKLIEYMEQYSLSKKLLINDPGQINDIFYKFNSIKYLDDIHISWIIETIKQFKNESILKIIKSSFSEKIKSKLLNNKISVDKNINILPFIKNEILNKLILPKIKAPTVIKDKNELLREDLGPILSVKSNKISEVVYMLGLHDISDSISTTINSQLIKDVISQVDEKYREYLISLFRKGQGPIISSLTMKIIEDTLVLGGSIKKLINFYGSFRLFMAMKLASPDVKDAFFAYYGIKIMKLINKHKSDVDKKKCTPYVRQLLSTIFYVTGS